MYHNPNCIFSLHIESETCILKVLKRTGVDIGLIAWDSHKCYKSGLPLIGDFA